MNEDEVMFEAFCAKTENELNRQLTPAERTALRHAYDADISIFLMDQADGHAAG